MAIQKAFAMAEQVILDDVAQDIDCELLADKADVGKRLDMFVLQHNEELTRSRIKTLIDSENIKVNGEAKKSGYALRCGDLVSICLPPVTELSLEPYDYALDIVYEDDCLAVINKPRGMVTHPAPGSPSHTLVNALLCNLESLSDINGVIRPGIVHRLDKDTTGLIVVAKTNKAHVSLSQQIATKQCHRHYIALLCGVIKADEGVICANIDRSRKDRKLMTVVREGGRFAETHFKVLERYSGYCLAEFELKTGRTHQIRVHSKHIGHPIVGDSVYGGSTKLFNNGQLLHAYKLSFNHPVSGEYMEFTADLPDYFEQVLAKCRQSAVK